jgi:hypothetical protein
LDYYWRFPGKEGTPVWADLIEQHSQLTNGWTKDELRRMKDFFCGKPVILGGLLRVFLPPADKIRIAGTVSSTEYHLELADAHIRSSRLPVLKDSTKQRFLEQAKHYEIGQFGRLLRSPHQQQGNKAGEQRLLFDWPGDSAQ